MGAKRERERPGAEWLVCAVWCGVVGLESRGDGWLRVGAGAVEWVRWWEVWGGLRGVVRGGAWERGGCEGQRAAGGEEGL